MFLRGHPIVYPDLYGGDGMSELKIEARVDKLDEVLAFVDGGLEALECPPKIQIQLDVAVEEIFVNIASYAYSPGEGMATVMLEEEDGGDAVAITFVDEGIPYDPLKKPDPDTTLKAEERQIGGLGIYMVKKSMDRVDYEYRDNKNILTIRKRLSV